MSGACTAAEVLTRFLPAYKQWHKLSPQQAKITNLLGACRTEALGGQKLHILPFGFKRIRHYGFLANCHRKATL
ncbi:MAG: hypothetical protein COA42_15490 [Alteromonadaceae bacterium]|nr:MAG: hypothetical protein COA42_15490 [Alteromonadaceae bacterium]